MATAFIIDDTICHNGQHRPKRVPVRDGGGEIRTTCRDCGCVLVRTQATRRWFYSGQLA
jgi:hypothetical protein